MPVISTPPIVTIRGWVRGPSDGGGDRTRRRGGDREGDQHGSLRDRACHERPLRPAMRIGRSVEQLAEKPPLAPASLAVLAAMLAAAVVPRRGRAVRIVAVRIRVAQ